MSTNPKFWGRGERGGKTENRERKIGRGRKKRGEKGSDSYCRCRNRIEREQKRKGGKRETKNRAVKSQKENEKAMLVGEGENFTLVAFPRTSMGGLREDKGRGKGTERRAPKRLKRVSSAKWGKKEQAKYMSSSGG